jgi:hypothetical protein
MQEQKHTQSKIGKKWTPKGSYFSKGGYYNIRGYRRFNQLLKYLEDLWKKHGIEVEITDLNMICAPYISFRSGSVRNNAYIELFISSVRDELKEQEICGSCCCKGRDEQWEAELKQRGYTT